jgi:hypothetical protein
MKTLTHLDYLELKRVMTYASLRDVEEVKHAELVMTYLVPEWHLDPDYVPWTPLRKVYPSVV